MENTILASLPNTLLGWLAVATAVASGAVAGWGLVDRQMRDRRKDGLDAAADLVSILHTTVNELKERVAELEDEHLVHTREIAELRATKETRTKILQGRDENTMQFQHKVMEAVAIGIDTNKTVRSVEKQIGEMASAINRLAGALEKRAV